MKNYRRSFQVAFTGFKEFYHSEFNAKIHLGATVIVVLWAFLRDFGIFEWVLLSIAVGVVWMAELFNTAIEMLCDRITSEKEESIRKIKDISAAAVLCSVIFASIIGIYLFIYPVL
ncbi:diacylglycerol kinase family protein [bacterium]|nr:diacylglycerol kinase family protein [bacterium]